MRGSSPRMTMWGDRAFFFLSFLGAATAANPASVLADPEPLEDWRLPTQARHSPCTESGWNVFDIEAGARRAV